MPTIILRPALLLVIAHLARIALSSLPSHSSFPGALDSRAEDADVRPTTGCSLDQTKPPGDLTQCGNSTLFAIWRPKARFIAPEGWMNDPQGLFQRSDGTFHAGYQCHPRHIQWGNISQCSAFSKDLTFWTDANSWQDPRTLYPSQLYDIRGVFDGSIIKNGWDGHPTTIYTSTFLGALGSQTAEAEGAETQSLAYTTDGGASWTKLAFGAGGNPVIYQWPMSGLTGFRDPYAFESPRLSRLLGNTTLGGARGPNFLTISGGRHVSVDPDGGPMLFLYRQTAPGDVRAWTYLGVLLAARAGTSFSAWSGNFNSNFETAGATRLNAQGMATDDGADADAVDVLSFGTEGWALWAAVTYAATNGSVSAALDYVGVVDWGRAYATIYFPVQTAGRNRSVLVGWVSEDDATLVRQRGYQGAFTLFRDMYTKVVRNVDPRFAGLNETGSWGVRREPDGSTSVVTLGQTPIRETMDAYRAASAVSRPAARTLAAGNASGFAYAPFAAQPRGRHYALRGTLRFAGAARAGFRVLASGAQEYTDVYFDSANEVLDVERSHSSLVTTFDSGRVSAKHRLWPILNGNGTSSARQELNLTIFVDGSIVEVYANDVTVITTQAYPWLASSVGAGFLVAASAGGDASAAVEYTDVELWDGLIDAWPERPADTRQPLQWDGPLPNGDYGGIWAGW